MRSRIGDWQRGATRAMSVSTRMEGGEQGARDIA